MRRDGCGPTLAGVVAHHHALTHAQPDRGVGAVMIRAVQSFDEVFVLTGGGPGSATTFIVQYIYLTGFAEQIHLYAELVLAMVFM